MLKFISIGIHPMGVQIAWLLTSTHSKKLYAYLAEIWDMLLLRRMCQSEISYHDVTFTLECRGTNYRKSYGLRHRGWLGQKRTPACVQGRGMIEKVMNLSVRTFWMLPMTDFCPPAVVTCNLTGLPINFNCRAFEFVIRDISAPASQRQDNDLHLLESGMTFIAGNNTCSGLQLVESLSVMLLLNPEVTSVCKLWWWNLLQLSPHMDFTVHYFNVCPGLKQAKQADFFIRTLSLFPILKFLYVRQSAVEWLSVQKWIIQEFCANRMYIGGIRLFILSQIGYGVLFQHRNFIKYGNFALLSMIESSLYIWRYHSIWNGFGSLFSIMDTVFAFEISLSNPNAPKSRWALSNISMNWMIWPLSSLSIFFYTAGSPLRLFL